MPYDSAAPDPATDFVALFEASPNGYLVMSPGLRMIYANAQYLRGVGRTAEELYGRDVFDVFPNSPLRPDVDQADQVRSSMLRAVRTGQTDVLLGFRYDIPGADGVTFEPRFWNITNSPVTDAAGTTVRLLHHTEDITDFVNERRIATAAAATNAQLQERVTTAQADLLARSLELQRANDRLRAAGEHDRSIAFALQDAMLTRLPEPDHLQIAARYLTAADDQIGGDWYDAVLDPHGATSLVIGDVIGHDIHAATIMGQLRNMLRGLIVDRPDESPAELMTRLDHAMARLGIADLTTAALVTVEQPPSDEARDLRTLRWTNAGHPAPLLIHADGSTEELAGARSLLLGLEPGTVRSDGVVTVPAETLLLLYTDGLVETRDDDLDARKARLSASAAEHRALKAGEFLDAVLADMVGNSPSDDVAVLAVRFNTETEPRPLDTAPGGDTTRTVELPPRPTDRLPRG